MVCRICITLAALSALSLECLTILKFCGCNLGTIMVSITMWSNIPSLHCNKNSCTAVKLSRTWSAMWSWKLQLGSKNCVPLSEDIQKAAFAFCWECTLQHPAFGYVLMSFGILLRLGFKALLRPGELLRLRPRALLLEQGKYLIIRICDPNNK